MYLKRDRGPTRFSKGRHHIYLVYHNYRPHPRYELLKKAIDPSISSTTQTPTKVMRSSLLTNKPYIHQILHLYLPYTIGLSDLGKENQVKACLDLMENTSKSSWSAYQSYLGPKNVFTTCSNAQSAHDQTHSHLESHR